MTFRFCFLFLLLNSSYILQAQVFNLQHYHERTGLGTPLVKSIAKDTMGIVWLATDDGIVRFDGTNFQVYGEDILPSKYVKHILCRKNGELWATTDGGIIRINPNPEAISFEVILKNSIQKNDTQPFYPKQMYEDKQGVLWFSDNLKVFRYQDDRFKVFLNQTKNTTDHFHRSFSFFEDKYQHFYAFSQPGFLFHYDRKTATFRELPVPAEIDEVFHVLVTPQGRILVSSLTGVYEIELDKNGNFTKLQLIDREADISYFTMYNQEIYASSWTKGLLHLKQIGDNFRVERLMPENIIGSSYIFASDRELWLSTDNGLFLLTPRTFLTTFVRQTGKKYIQALAQRNQNELIFSSGDAVFSYNYRDTMPSIIYQNAEENILGLSIFGHELRLGSASGKVIYKRDNHLKIIDLSKYGGAVYSMFSATDGSLWVCQDKNPKVIRIFSDGNIKLYGAEEGLTCRPVVIRQDTKGEIYIGGIGENQNDFIFKYNKIKNIFELLTFSFTFEPRQRLVINDMQFDAENTLFIGSSEGLIQLKNQKFERLPMGNMTTEAVKAMVFTDSNQLWIASAKGVIKYNGATPHAFGEFEGLPSKIVSYRGLLLDHQDKLWAATASGMAYTESLDEIYQTPTPLITQLETTDTEHTALNLKPKISESGFLNISFICPTYPSGGTEFFMELYSQKDTVSKRIDGSKPLLLSHLKSGEYTLELRAKKRGGFQKSKPVYLQFTVYRVWYKTLWGGILMVILIFSITGILLWINTQRLKRGQIKLEKIISERTQEIEGQKNQINKLLQTATQTNEELKLSEEELKQQTEELTIINENLAQSENRFRQLLESISDTVLVINANLEIVLLNNHAIMISGIGRQEAIGNELFKVFPSFKNSMFHTAFITVLHERISQKVLGEVRLKNNRQAWIEARIYPVQEGVLCIATDNTERERAKQKLQKAHEELKVSEEEIRQNAEELKATNEKLQDEKNKVQQMYHELQSAQSQLVQSEKMASLGQLVAGIAHEINNPINFIFAGSESLKSLLEEFDEVAEKYDELNEVPAEQLPQALRELNELKQDLEFEDTRQDIFNLLHDIQTGAERTVEIVKGLRTFSRLDEDTLKRTDLHENLNATLVILRNQYKGRIKIQKEYDEKLPDIECYPGKLNQVFMNIISNAIQAIEGEGKITIKTIKLSDNQYQVAITDTGGGIPEEVKNRIFDPFFTTKEVGKGTGLGLSISLGIIKKHHGKLEVNSKVGEGTTFLITLPTEIQVASMPDITEN